MDPTPASHPAPLRAHLLGAVRLSVGDRAIPDRAWPRRNARALLLLLLATPGHRLPRDRVLDLLWPRTPPEAAPNALRVARHALRRVLEPELPAGGVSAYVGATRDAVALHPGAGLWVDADAFEAALARAETAPPVARPAVLREALALYGGICSSTSRSPIGRSRIVSGCDTPGAARCWSSPNSSRRRIVPMRRSPCWSDW